MGEGTAIEACPLNRDARGVVADFCAGKIEYCFRNDANQKGGE